MNLKHTLRQLTKVSTDQWTKLAIAKVEQVWPDIQKALIREAGLGKKTYVLELGQFGDTPDIVVRLAAVALAEQLKAEGVSARVLRPEKKNFPWEQPRQQYGVEASW